MVKDIPSWNKPQILVNRIVTPDGTELVSHHRHDFKTYKDANGYEYMVDGGTDYLKRHSVPEAPYDEASIYLSEDHESNREFFKWGTYGKEGQGPRKFVPLRELTDDHLEAILETQTHIRTSWVGRLMQAEVKWRKDQE